MTDHDPGAHPEVAIGIPKIVVTAKGLAVKAKYAQMVNYRGPLTLDAAIEQQVVTPERAERLIAAWEEATGWKWRAPQETIS
jgi:hypothetical protein